MAAPITIDELSAAMAAAVDAEGNDIRLAEWVASLSPEDRRASEDNLRQWIEDARRRLAAEDP